MVNRAIQLIYFFTAGPDEVKCWQIRKGSKAPQAAGLSNNRDCAHSDGGRLCASGAIHSDFERGFICAEVMKFDELHELKTESAVKAAGKYRQEGKNYVVQVIRLHFSAVTSHGHMTGRRCDFLQVQCDIQRKMNSCKARGLVAFSVRSE